VALAWSKLGERGEGRFIGKVVLARFHHPAAERAAVAWYGRGGDEAHRRVGEDFVQSMSHLHLGEFGAEILDLLRVGS